MKYLTSLIVIFTMVQFGNTKALEPSDPNHFPPYQCGDLPNPKVILFSHFLFTRICVFK